MAKARILLVDDDPRLRSILLRYLEMQDFSVCGVASTALMDRMLEREFFDLLLLDVMMPGEDGFEACARLRRQEPQLPIIMLTARGDLDDRVQGLSLGADDYLAKPFEPEELVARIRAVLRRSQEPDMAKPSPGAIHFGPFRLALDTRSLWRGEERIPLTETEFSLLHALASHPWQTLSRDRLIQMIRAGDEVPGARGVDVFISRLRRLIEDDPATPRYLQTVWGRGYVFVPSEDHGSTAT
ncbi:response regulator [Acidithiobacillus caldus]|jgi:two-component system phosphate regulon response regulator OmpR|uniref:Two-component system response regulator OmpR n=4 Tax=Acidithiobacillaceae TaxID=225058 RepID=F9ZTA4_ACICS|nr:response regulator [Acidithiobacillus caldus]AEK56710.1 Two-component system response regulator OmpR [Acidithiobacillus caldus SM-1]AIA53946.1 Two-component system response regulator OmpR [Acidithiobacillus caldus ATCC 51756]MCE5420139.1 response regulator [Acidithiobacillus sp.]AUW31622.1 response regulator [Acidithiobacillus caldus]MBU2729077.1 response regulator [Acidithiobacillus caldus]